MTDHHAGYIVTLRHDVREDDAEQILTALRMIKGVASVKPVVADIHQHIADARAHQEWRTRVYNMLAEEAQGDH